MLTSYNIMSDMYDALPGNKVRKKVLRVEYKYCEGCTTFGSQSTFKGA